MPLTQQQMLGKLREVSKLVADLIASIEQAKLTVSPEVASLVRELMNRGYCLSREHKLEEGEPTVWGMCSTHYQTALKLTKIPRERGGITAEFLFKNGWWSDEGKRRGRRPKNAALVKAITGSPPSHFGGKSDAEVIAMLNAITLPLDGKMKSPDQKPEVVAATESSDSPSDRHPGEFHEKTRKKSSRRG